MMKLIHMVDEKIHARSGSCRRPLAPIASHFLQVKNVAEETA